MAELEQAIGFGFVVTIGSGGIEAKGIEPQVIDLAGGRPEISLDSGPTRLSESPQENGEAVIAELCGVQGLTEEVRQATVMGVGPGLHAGFGVSRLGKQEGKPTTGKLATAQALVQVMPSQTPI